MKNISELLETNAYSNQAGSTFIFRSGKIIKNEEVIGSYRLERRGDITFLIISAPDSGTVEFRMEIRQSSDKPLAIDLYSKNNDQAFMTLFETEAEMQQKGSFLWESL